jgi:acyl carrier protein
VNGAVQRAITRQTNLVVSCAVKPACFFAFSFAMGDLMNTAPRYATLRRILSESARLDVPVDQIEDATDLYEHGLSSLATVQIMLAVEDAFDIEIPDAMLTRRLFQSIDSLAAAVLELAANKAEV